MTDKFIHTEVLNLWKGHLAHKSVRRTLRIEPLVPQGLIPQETIVCDLFISDLGNGYKFGEDKKLRGMFGSPERHSATQRDLSKLKAWADRKLMKFSNGNCMWGEQYPASVHTAGLSGKQMISSRPGGSGGQVDHELATVCLM